MDDLQYFMAFKNSFSIADLNTQRPTFAYSVLLADVVFLFVCLFIYLYFLYLSVSHITLVCFFSYTAFLLIFNTALILLLYVNIFHF